MKIALGYRQEHHNDQPVETYSRTVHRELKTLGHTVIPFGPGQKRGDLDAIGKLNDFGLVLELDCGRDRAGKFHYDVPDSKEAARVPTAVWLIDSHGNPELHMAVAPTYKHVFFAVWDRRSLFGFHPSAHWCPNATDEAWFNMGQTEVRPQSDFGFFGSKGGLNRADPLQKVCDDNGWTCDIRQINGGFKHRWPFTGVAMGDCKFLFNHGQKHDGPNLRVVESMAMCKALVTDTDPRSGMDKIFEAGTHYLGYEAYTYRGLEDACRILMENPAEAARIACAGHEEIVAKHLVKHRVAQILEVVG